MNHITPFNLIKDQIFRDMIIASMLHKKNVMQICEEDAKSMGSTNGPSSLEMPYFQSLIKQLFTFGV